MTLGDAGRGLQLPLSGCWILQSISETLIHGWSFVSKSRWGWCQSQAAWKSCCLASCCPPSLLITGFSEVEQEKAC